MKMLSKYAIGSAVALALCASYPAAAQDGGLTEDGVEAVGAALIAAGLTGVPEGLDEQDGSILGDGAVDLTGHEPGDDGVTVTAEVDTDKDIRSIELIAKLKLAVIFVGNVLEPEGAAESDVTVTQFNQDNNVDHGDNDGSSVSGGPELQLYADIDGSVNDNSGVVQLNQDVGNMVNQGNVASVAVATGDSFSTFTDANAAAEQRTENNISETLVDFELSADSPGNKTATITDSINGNSGIIHVNQNSGDMNNQLNANSIAISAGAIVALSEADLGQFNSGNSVGDTNTFKFDTVAGSINGNSGIINVNQSSGAMNNQATVVSFSGLAPIGN